ncbi:hypothetical protein GCM10023321_38560 [Pseudonocardia eucalypti]|uniref:Uncharacterized protein n=1 Tax=Pseudonocardia eucalypti TaxID=648755 RepID=A0ABP9QAU4_9PSEU|nr:hypothetical protein [Pseudonocardia eucalypti]
MSLTGIFEARLKRFAPRFLSAARLPGRGVATVALLANLADPKAQSAQLTSPLMRHAQAQYGATGVSGASIVMDRPRGWEFMIVDVTGTPANKPPYVSASERCP